MNPVVRINAEILQQRGLVVEQSVRLRILLRYTGAVLCICFYLIEFVSKVIQSIILIDYIQISYQSY